MKRLRRTRLGFTLIEVMLALAILGMALVILVKSIATNATGAASAFYMGVATDLARGKIYDLEEQLLDEGFQDTEQEDEGDFADEGYPGITWTSKIEVVELPSYEKLVALANPDPAAAGPDGEAGPGDKFGSSALGGMIGMFGGGLGGGADSAQEAETGSFIAGQYALIQQVLKASIRKITLNVKWTTGVDRDEADFVLYVTDPAGMQKALGGLGT